jgi:hypothetical protein
MSLLPPWSVAGRMRWAKAHPWVAASYFSALGLLLLMLVLVPWEADEFPGLETRLFLAAANWPFGVLVYGLGLRWGSFAPFISEGGSAWIRASSSPPGSVYGPVSIPARSKTPGEKLSGMAVVIGVRLRAQAAPSDVMVWSTVGDLVAVSRLDFEDGGEHELTGVHRRWGLYRVARRHPVMPRNQCSTVAMNRGAGGVRCMAVDLRNKASTGSTCFSHLSLARSVVVMWRRGRRLQGTTQRRDQRVGEAASWSRLVMLRVRDLAHP